MELQELLRVENQNGGRLRLGPNNRTPSQGPLRVSGKDSRGRTTSIVGDEAFIARMILSWPWHSEASLQEARP